MDTSAHNYTPINTSTLHQGKSKKNIFFTTASSFLIAMSLSGIVYLNRLSTSPQITNTQASGASCATGFPVNPESVKASTIVDNQIVDLKDGEKITSYQVIFDWEPVAGAKTYFVELNQEKGVPDSKVDPAKTGKETNQSTFKFDNLRPNTTYYLYVRSRYADSKLGFSVTSPTGCTAYVPAAPLFSFTTLP